MKDADQRVLAELASRLRQGENTDKISLKQLLDLYERFTDVLSQTGEPLDLLSNKDFLKKAREERISLDELGEEE
jgi:hypothetical protein